MGGLGGETRRRIAAAATAAVKLLPLALGMAAVLTVRLLLAPVEVPALTGERPRNA